ncbi:MAG: hypothetical protein ABIH49_02260 [archaeon]
MNLKKILATGFAFLELSSLALGAENGRSHIRVVQTNYGEIRYEKGRYVNIKVDLEKLFGTKEIIILGLEFEENINISGRVADEGSRVSTKTIPYPCSIDKRLLKPTQTNGYLELDSRCLY